MIDFTLVHLFFVVHLVLFVVVPTTTTTTPTTSSTTNIAHQLLPVLLAQTLHHLFNSRYVVIARTNERNQTFRGWLPERPRASHVRAQPSEPVRIRFRELLE